MAARNAINGAVAADNEANAGPGHQPASPQPMPNRAARQQARVERGRGRQLESGASTGRAAAQTSR